MRAKLTLTDVQHDAGTGANTQRANDRGNDDFRIVAEREMSEAANSRDSK